MGYCRKRQLVTVIDGSTAVTISIDQTFRAAGKAKMVNSARQYEKPWGGGILNALNERGQTLAWVSASRAPKTERRALADRFPMSWTTTYPRSNFVKPKLMPRSKSSSKA